jgi:hypothetical protein
MRTSGFMKRKMREKDSSKKLRREEWHDLWRKLKGRTVTSRLIMRNA